MAKRKRPARKAATTLCVNVQCGTAVQGATPGAGVWLVGQLRKAVKILRISGGNVAVTLVGDRQMRQLHKRFMGDARPTDVLSFDLRERADGPLDADIIICADEAYRQAAARGHAVRLEMLLYALHGLLHQVGYDDVAPADAAVMHAREDELLRRLGLPAVYAAAVARRK